MQQRGNNYHAKFSISLHTNISVENIRSPDSSSVDFLQANDSKWSTKIIDWQLMLPAVYVGLNVISFLLFNFWQYEYLCMFWISLDLSGIRNTECKQNAICSFVLPSFVTSKCYKSGKRCKIGHRKSVLSTCLQYGTASSTFRCLVVSVVSYRWLIIVVLPSFSCHATRSAVQCYPVCSIIQLDQPAVLSYLWCHTARSTMQCCHIYSVIQLD